MIWHRIPVIRSFFGADARAAVDPSKRWQRAFDRDPELAHDIIRQSGLMAMQPVEMIDGYPQSAPLDPHRLAYEAGRRDLALLLLAQGHITPLELNTLMETPDVS